MKTEEKTPRITTADYLDFAFLHRRAEALIDNPKLKILFLILRNKKHLRLGE